MSKPRFSILTPTWNRAHLLHNVFDSLNSQTYKNFEWIIADDGSTDETPEVVEYFLESSKFSIVYLRSSSHVGKPRIDNAALVHVSGDLVLWCDSDDTLTSDCLSILDANSDIFLSSNSTEYLFLSALVSNTIAPSISLDLRTCMDKPLTWNEFVSKFNINSDLLLCFKSSILCRNYFPEVDTYVPESVLWNQLGDIYYVSHIPQALLFKNYNSPHAVSFTFKMKYNRGYTYALISFLNSSCGANLSPLQLIFKLTNLIRYSIHGQLAFNFTFLMLSRSSHRYIFLLLVPFSILLAYFDKLRGIVIYTHNDVLSESKPRISVIKTYI